jgi:putative restriction endonuclease
VFRAEVIAAWEHRCAFCGLSVQLDHADLALDAAHIRWCQFGGPDSLNNGLACCSIHHQAFDRGAISISDEQVILVSSRVYGNEASHALFGALSRSPLRAPNRKSAAPKRDFLGWHREQVFRGEAHD